MGHRIARQPDGLFRVWSTVVDDNIITNATESELIAFYAEKAAEEARRHTIDAIADALKRPAYPMHVDPFDWVQP